MSHDPSPYKPPPQGRWPQATPPVPWPSYRDGDVYRDGAVYRGQERLDGQYAVDHQGAYATAAGYQRQPGSPRASGGYGAPEYGAPEYGGPGYGAPGYGDARDGDPWGARGYDPRGGEYPTRATGYDWADNGYDYDYDSGSYGSGSGSSYGSGRITDGFDGAPVDFAGPGARSAPPGARSAPPGARSASGTMLAAPDAGVDPDGWQAERDRIRAARQRGALVGAVTGLLAVAIAISVSTLAAALIRPQAAPILAVGDVFVNRVPAGLRHVAMTHFGSHGRTALLLGMYLAIACVALVTGVLSRRTAALGVASLAAFTVLGAFVAVTRPQGRMTDVVPAVIGGVAGVAALLWLQRASAPVKPAGPGRSARPVTADRAARGGNRRRMR